MAHKRLWINSITPLQVVRKRQLFIGAPIPTAVNYRLLGEADRIWKIKNTDKTGGFSVVLLLCV